MLNQLEPFEWYYPTPSSSPVPCAWHGWVSLGEASLGVRFIVVRLYGA